MIGRGSKQSCILTACGQNSPVLRCRTAEVSPGFRPPEPQLWTQKQTAVNTGQSPCVCVCACVTKPPPYTQQVTHNRVRGNKQEARHLKHKRSPRSAFAAHRQDCPRRPPTLPVTVETATLYCQRGRSVSFCPASLLLWQKPIPRLAAPARGEASENRAQFVCSGSPLPTGLVFVLFFFF